MDDGRHTKHDEGVEAVSRPYIAEIAYETFCTYMDAEQPSWDMLSVSFRLAWTMAIRTAIQEAHTVRCTTPLKIEGLPAKSPHHRWKSP